MDAAEQQTKTEPDLSYVLEIKPATKIMHLMFTFINTALIPLSQTSLTTRREMVKLSNTTLTNLEQKVNNIIQKTVDTVIVYTGSLLAKQKKQDFRPKDDEVSLTTLQTATCHSVCTFLSKVHGVATEALDGANLNGFLNEIGAGLRGFLLEHLKKFQVNQAGAIMLSKFVSPASTTVALLTRRLGISPNTATSSMVGMLLVLRMGLSCCTRSEISSSWGEWHFFIPQNPQILTVLQSGCAEGQNAGWCSGQGQAQCPQAVLDEERRLRFQCHRKDSKYPNSEVSLSEGC